MNNKMLISTAHKLFDDSLHSIAAKLKLVKYKMITWCSCTAPAEVAQHMHAFTQTLHTSTR